MDKKYIQLEAPKEDKWEEIWYQPQPFVTILEYPESEKYWRNLGYDIEVVPKEEKPHAFSHLVRGVKVKLIPPNKKEMYVEPLARIHKTFWELVAEVEWEMYDGFRKPDFARRAMVASLLCDFYWASSYSDYTPKSWVSRLNSALAIFQDNYLKTPTRRNELDVQTKPILEKLESMMMPHEIADFRERQAERVVRT